MEKRLNEGNTEGRGSVITPTAVIYMRNKDNLNKMTVVLERNGYI